MGVFIFCLTDLSSNMVRIPTPQTRGLCTLLQCPTPSPILSFHWLSSQALQSTPALFVVPIPRPTSLRWCFLRHDSTSPYPPASPPMIPLPVYPNPVPVREPSARLCYHRAIGRWLGLHRCTRMPQHKHVLPLLKEGHGRTQAEGCSCSQSCFRVPLFPPMALLMASLRTLRTNPTQQKPAGNTPAG